MKIEKAIKQKEFKSSYQRMLINLLYTAADFEKQINDRIKAEGKISHPQYNVLRILRGAHPKPCTLQYVRERMLNKSADASRIVERLRKAGLTDRKTCEANRRKIDIGITNQGLRLLKELEKPLIELDNRLLNLTNEEADELSALLDKLRGE